MHTQCPAAASSSGAESTDRASSGCWRTGRVRLDGWESGFCGRWHMRVAGQQRRVRITARSLCITFLIAHWSICISLFLHQAQRRVPRPTHTRRAAMAFLALSALSVLAFTFSRPCVHVRCTPSRPLAVTRCAAARPRAPGLWCCSTGSFCSIASMTPIWFQLTMAVTLHGSRMRAPAMFDDGQIIFALCSVGGTLAGFTYKILQEPPSRRLTTPLIR